MIDVATPLDPSVSPSLGVYIAYLDPDRSFVVSWENVSPRSGGGLVAAQVRLAPSGRTTVCYGRGRLDDSDTITTGLQDLVTGEYFRAFL